MESVPDRTAEGWVDSGWRCAGRFGEQAHFSPSWGRVPRGYDHVVRESARTRPPQTLEKPAGAAAALGMPLALKLAGSEGENAIALSYVSSDLSSGVAPLARFIAGADKEFGTLDALFQVSE